MLDYQHKMVGIFEIYKTDGMRGAIEGSCKIFTGRHGECLKWHTS